MGILGLRRKKKVVEEPAPEPQVVEARSGPALMLLVPEVVGGTSFRALPFNSTSEAAEYLSTLIPASVPRIHAFWAMLEKPEDSPAGGEAMVLIRSEAGGDLVHVVSFVDIDSAQSFARFEVKRGLALGSLIIWWAALVTISQTEDGIQLTPAEPPEITPEALSSASAPAAVSSSLEKARRRQEEEKSRLQAELEEIRRRQAQTEELRKRQVQMDEERKQLALAEKQRRQTKAEEQRRFQAEAEDIARLRAEAEELRKRQAEAEEHERREAQERRLQAEQDKKARREAEAEEKRRLQAELEEIEREQTKAEERERQEAVERGLRAAAEERRRQAAAEEMLRLQAEEEEQARQVAEELRLLAEEEKGRGRAEADANRRLQAEAKQTRRLQAELEEIKRGQGEAEERWRQEAEERRLRAEAEEEKRREVEEEKRRLEAEETRRMQAELAEIKRHHAEAEDRSLRTEEDKKRRQAEAERAGRLQAELEEIKRQQGEAEEQWHQEAEERRIRAEAEEQKRRAVEDDKRRLETEEARLIQTKLEEIRRRQAEAQLFTAPAEKFPLDTGPERTGTAGAAEGALAETVEPPAEVSGGGERAQGPVVESTALYESLAQSPPPMWAERSDAGRNEAPDTVIEETTPEPEDAAQFQDALHSGVPREPERVEFVPGPEGTVVTDEIEAVEEQPVAWQAEPEPERLEFVPEPQAVEMVEARYEPDGEPAEARDDDLSFEDEEPVVAEPPSFLREDGADQPVDEPVSPQSLYESDVREVDGEPRPPRLPRQDSDGRSEVAADAPVGEVHEPEPDKDPGPVSPEPAELEMTPATEFPVEETVAVGANGAVSTAAHDAGPADEEAPETIPGEEDLSPEMSAFLRSRRRDNKDNPFRGFDSPPGRF